MISLPGRRAASKISSKTGIDYVVRTTQSGISSGVEHVSSGVKSSVQSFRQSARRSSITSQFSGRSSDNKSGTDSSGQKRESAPVRQSSIRSLLSEGAILEESEEEADDSSHQQDRKEWRFDSEEVFDRNEEDLIGYGIENDEAEAEAKTTIQETALPAEYPDQDIDVSGPSTGKKITDDLAEVRDKMHELTWHLFDDRTYVIKHPKAVFFNELKKGRIKSQDPSKEMDKYLHVS